MILALQFCKVEEVEECNPFWFSLMFRPLRLRIYALNVSNFLSIDNVLFAKHDIFPKIRLYHCLVNMIGRRGCGCYFVDVLSAFKLLFKWILLAMVHSTSYSSKTCSDQKYVFFPKSVFRCAESSKQSEKISNFDIFKLTFFQSHRINSFHRNLDGQCLKCGKSFFSFLSIGFPASQNWVSECPKKNKSKSYSKKSNLLVKEALLRFYSMKGINRWFVVCRR